MMKKTALFFVMSILVGCSDTTNPDPGDADTATDGDTSSDADMNPDGDANPDGDTTSSAITPHITPSRTEGVAPLLVHFDGTDSTDPDVSDPFLDLNYSWDFGDPDSGTWAWSGKLRASATGAVTAHLFETPGEYTVTLTVRNQSGESATVTTQITVSDPETVYSGQDTVCIANSADFTDCPAGANEVVAGNFDALSDHVGDGTRILFRRGDTFPVTAALNISNITGPTTIGAFGQCADPDERGICTNAPVVHNPASLGDSPVVTFYRVNDIRLQDLNFEGTAGVTGGVTGLTNILHLRLRIRNVSFVGLGCSHWTTLGHDVWSIVDSDLSGNVVNQLYTGSERLVIMGNYFGNSDESHVVRVWQSYKGIIAHNVMEGASLTSGTGRHALKFHGPGEDAIADDEVEGHLRYRSQQTIIADNRFGSSGPWTVTIGAQDSGSDERLTRIIVERNWFDSGIGEYGSPVQLHLLLSARQILVRNNVFDAENSSNGYTSIAVEQRGIGPNPNEVEILNNLLYHPDNPPNGIAFVRADAEDETQLVNNLVYAPNVTVFNFATGNFSDECNLSQTDPGWVTQGSDYHLSAGSPAINSGCTVSLLDDFDGLPRDDSIDIGPFEHR